MCPPEQQHRWRLEPDCDFSEALRHPLSRAQVKRHARPSPIVDRELHRDVSFGAGFGIDLRLLAITRRRLAFESAGAVLPAHRPFRDVFGFERADCAQHLGLLIANRLGVERIRRFHRGQRNQRHDMIRHHVAQRAGRFIECAAMLDADGFRHRDLHVIDIIVVPQRFEEAVAEAERHDVLDGLFAEIVIDSVDLILVQACANLAIERVRRFQVVAERLLDDHSSPMTVRFLW